MRLLYGLDLSNGLDDIVIGSVYQRDILTLFAAVITVTDLPFVEICQ